MIRATTGLLKNDNKGMLCKLGCTGKVDIGEAAWCLGCNAASKIVFNDAVWFLGCIATMKIVFNIRVEI